MKITKPTFGGAVANFTKGIKQLEAVIADAGKTAQKARETIAAEDVKMREAQAEIERASRVKAKIEDLLS